ncbi:MAG: hypothetical protein ACLPGW_16110 [Roseiarcus sp.]
MRVATLLLAAILSTTALGPAGAQEGRYLYVVGCGARVDKLDVAEGHKVASFDLAAAAKAIPSGPGPLDGCLANQAVYDSKSSIFYTVVPLQAETKPNDAKDYRVLGFSIPALKLVYSQPAGDDLKDAPRIEASPAGGVKIVATPNPGPPLYLDLSAFESEMGPLGNQILEVSDGRFLLRLHMFNRKEWGFAVVDPTAHKLVVLKDLPAMTAPQAHLTPGGGAVLVLASTGARSFFQSTGNLTLFDATTGLALRRISDSRIKTMYFLAIAPTGKAIFHSDENYRFIDLGAKYPGEPAMPPSGYTLLPQFYADR